MTLDKHSGGQGDDFLNRLGVFGLVLDHRPPCGGGVGKRLPPNDGTGQIEDALDLAQGGGGFHIVVALRVGGIEDSHGPKLVVDLAGFLDQLGHFFECPNIESAGLHGHEQRMGDSEGGPKAAGIASANIDDDVVVLCAKLPNVGADGGPLQTDGGISGGSDLLGPQFGKAGRGALLVAVHKQHVAPDGGTHNRQIDGKGGLANPALRVADGQYHSDCSYALFVQRIAIIVISF